MLQAKEGRDNLEQQLDSQKLKSKLAVEEAVEAEKTRGKAKIEQLKVIIKMKDELLNKDVIPETQDDNQVNNLLEDVLADVNAQLNAAQSDTVFIDELIVALDN